MLLPGNMQDKSYFLFFLFLAMYLSASVQIKIACMGDSNTLGQIDTGGQQDLYSWPTQLQKLLGNEYYMEKLGFNAATLLNESDMPWKSSYNAHYYNTLVNLNPDIIIIMLGTNDIKPHTWNLNQFLDDYEDWMLEFRNYPSNPKCIWRFR